MEARTEEMSGARHASNEVDMLQVERTQSVSIAEVGDDEIESILS